MAKCISCYILIRLSLYFLSCLYLEKLMVSYSFLFYRAGMLGLEGNFLASTESVVFTSRSSFMWICLKWRRFFFFWSKCSRSGSTIRVLLLWSPLAN